MLSSVCLTQNYMMLLLVFGAVSKQTNVMKEHVTQSSDVTH